MWTIIGLNITLKSGTRLVNKYDNVYFVSPAYISWGLSELKNKFPNRVLDVGIAEQHCVTFSSAMALNNNNVFCYLAGWFLPRAVDQIIDVCIQKISMVFVIYFGGIADMGYTHQGIYTFPILNMLPNVTIMQPCGFDEYDRMIDEAVKITGPVFIQTPEENIKVNKKDNSISQIKTGGKLSILPLGNMMGKALRIADMIDDIEVLYAPIIKPFDTKLLKKYVSKTGKLLILEDGLIRSGLGEDIVIDLQKQGLDFEYKIMGVEDKFPEQGNLDEVYEYLGLDNDTIIKEAKKLIGK